MGEDRRYEQERPTGIRSSGCQEYQVTGRPEPVPADTDQNHS
tara:strand:+ start:195 stop:320 length:126 start_codon:yes stop_codon:yes gene_type:complete